VLDRHVKPVLYILNLQTAKGSIHCKVAFFD
jgi:hypothetical protein